MVAPWNMAAFMALKACSSGVGLGRHVMPRRPKPVMRRGLGSGIVWVCVDKIIQVVRIQAIGEN